jgi:hypothetical protein
MDWRADFAEMFCVWASICATRSDKYRIKH